MNPINKDKNIWSRLYNKWDNCKKYTKASIIAATIISLFISRNVYAHLYRKYKNLPPGPIGYPIFGSFLEMRRDSLKFFSSLPLFYGPISCFTLGNTNIISINDPLIARNIYINHSQSVLTRYVTGVKHPIYNSFSLQNGAAWWERRKIIQSQLLTITNSEFIDKIARNLLNNHIFKEFDNKSDNKQLLYTRPLFRNLTFSIMYCAIFGEYPEFNGHLFHLYNKFIIDIFESQQPSMELTLFFGEKSWISQFIWNHSKYKRLFQNSVQKMCDLTLLKYLEIKQMYKEASTSKTKTKTQEHNCYCDYIYKYQMNPSSKIKYSDNDVSADINVMIEAGVDTTATTIEFAIVLATIYPHIQQDIYQELKCVFGNVEAFKLDSSKIHLIPKLRAYIHETLRLFAPAAQSFLRKITKDIDVNVNGYRYKLLKDSLVHINIQGINDNSKYWSVGNAKEMNLELWLDQNGNFVKHLSFTTFSLSKRDCPGKSLSIRELLFVLGMLFLRYKFVANEYGYKYAKDIPIRPQLTIIMDPEIGVTVEKR
eukprot:295434_1